MDDLDNIRLTYAEGIRDLLRARLRIELSPALVAAFAKVRREHFLGPEPWLIRQTNNKRWQRFACWLRRGDRLTSEWTTDPKRLYQHDAVVAIDASRGLNNGQPSGLASWLHFLELQAGDLVLHVGCGLGYYTAIMVEAVGPTGRVIGVEIDPELASRARQNLAHLSRVEVLQGDGGEYDPGPVDAIFVNAGATHPRPVWLDSLKPGGRLIIPLTGDNGMGGILRVKRQGQGYAARFIFTAVIFNCVGSRDAGLSERLRDGFTRGEWRLVQSLRREPHERGNTCWLHGDGFCLSTLSITTDT